MFDRNAICARTAASLTARLLASLLLLSLAGCLGDDAEKPDAAPASGGATGSSGDTGGTPPPPPTPTNSAPTISGSPITATKTSVAYSFQPAATDPDGDKLTFEVRAKPRWAAFDTATGKLSGTPVETDAGTYANIEILVSDGKAQAALPAFTITVSPPVIGSATLSWQPPSLNEDGTPLTDLSGYIVRYGKDPANLGQKVSLTNPGLTTVVVENLVEGTWYFTLASVNASGVESRPTGYVSKTIS